MKNLKKLGVMCAAFALGSTAAQAIDVLYICNSGNANAAYQAFIEAKFGTGTWVKAVNGTSAGQVGGDLDRITDFPVNGSHGGTGITVKSYMESFDLIINGLGVTSTAYQDGVNGADWAAISKPVLFHSSLAARAVSGRPGMFSGDNNTSFTMDAANAGDTTRVSTTALADSIFSGVTTSTNLYDYAILTSVDTIATAGDPGTGGEIISKLTNATAITEARGIVFWDAGEVNGVGLTMAAKRAFMPLKNTAAPEAFATLTADGKIVLENLIDELLASAPVIFLPPSGLVAKSGVSEINLSWTASSGAVSYNVKRSENQGGPYSTISTAGTVTGNTFNDTGLTNGTTYYYVVSAVNAGATESGDSTEASTYPVPVVRPAASILYVAGADNAAYKNFATNGQFSNNTWTQKASGLTGNDLIGGDLDRTATFTGVGTMTVKAYLESFDLVIVGLPVSSGNFVDGANGADWAQLQVPVLFNAAFAARSLGGRPGMFLNDGSLTVTLAVPDDSVRESTSTLSDAIFNGVTSETDLYAALSTDTIGAAQSYGGGELISSVTDGVVSSHGVVFWDAGVLNGFGQLLLKNRAYLPLKGDVTADLKADGQIVLGNLINALLVPTATVLPPPGNLAAKSGINEITLTWAAAPGAVSYNVKRSETQGGPYTEVGTEVVGTTFTDTGLTNDTPYYYVVTSVNAEPFESVDSFEVTAVPVSFLYPGINILYVANSNSTVYQNFASNGHFANNTWTQKTTGTGTAIDQIGGDLYRTTDFTGAINAATGISVRDYLESFDLIIIGIPTTSSNFEDLADGAVWAEITKPILFHSAVAARSLAGRPGLFSQDNVLTITNAVPDETTRVSSSALADAILAGVGSETDLYDLTQADVINGIALTGSGEQITSMTDGVGQHYGIVFWAEGGIIAAGHYVSANRAFLPLKGSIDDLTDDGKVVLANLINEIQQPQTTSGIHAAYNEWAAENISYNAPNANPGFDQDGEGDGLSNGLEWILGGDPLAVDASSVLPVSSGDATTGLTLVFNRTNASASATLHVRWDSDLMTWGNDILINSNIPASGNNPTVSFAGEQATVNIPAANAVGGKIFARLKAELNP